MFSYIVYRKVKRLDYYSVDYYISNRWNIRRGYMMCNMLKCHGDIAQFPRKIQTKYKYCPQLRAEQVKASRIFTLVSRTATIESEAHV